MTKEYSFFGKRHSYIPAEVAEPKRSNNDIARDIKAAIDDLNYKIQEAVSNDVIVDIKFSQAPSPYLAVTLSERL